MLQIASTLAFCSLACRTASSVSAVSPDCEIATTSVLLVQHRVAVTEFAGQLHFDRQPRPVLDRVLGQQPGVIGGAAGDHEDLVDLAQFLIGQPLLVEHDPAVDEVAEQRVGDRGGLLGDLLEHEVLVAALLGGRQVPVDVERAALGGRALPSKSVIR